MSEHKAFVRWERQSEDFSYKTYNRAHEWDFGHGIVVPASAALNYRSERERADTAQHPVDPEQAFVAALASCHMLTFLAVASQKRYVVDRYDDEAVGVLAKNADGQWAITVVTLHPRIVFSGEQIPDAETLQKLHEMAHHGCFLANSVKTQINIE